MLDLPDETVFRDKIGALVRRKLALLNLQLGATVAAALMLVLIFGWYQQPLGCGAILVASVHAGQAIDVIRGIPAHLRINRDSPAGIQDLNRLSLGIEVTFVVLWVTITALLVWATLRAPVA